MDKVFNEHAEVVGSVASKRGGDMMLACLGLCADGEEGRVGAFQHDVLLGVLLATEVTCSQVFLGWRVRCVLGNVPPVSHPVVPDEGTTGRSPEGVTTREWLDGRGECEGCRLPVIGPVVRGRISMGSHLCMLGKVLI